MAFVDVVANDDQMHDWKDAGAAEIILLAGAIVGEQAHDIGVPVERARQIGADNRVDFRRAPKGR